MTNKTLKEDKLSLKDEFLNKFKITSQDVEWFGDGHFCVHHPDDPAHSDKCYSHPSLPYIADWWLSKFDELEKRVREENDRPYVDLMEEVIDVDSYQKGLTKFLQILNEIRGEGK